MARPGGNPDIVNIGKKTQFDGNTAVIANKKSQDAKAFTKELMNLVAGKIDAEKASKKFVERIEAGDLKALQLWFEYNAQKPATRVEAEVEDNTLRVIIDDGSED